MNKLAKLKDEVIVERIFLIRGVKVMLDRDLAELYRVETRRLNEQISRNKERFPKHFMFRLTKKEYLDLMSQNATSRWGGTRKLPYAFTQHGILQAANVLKSKSAVLTGIRIIEVLIKMTEMLSAHKDILLKLEQLEQKVNKHDQSIQIIFNALKKLLNPEIPERKPMGFQIKAEYKKNIGVKKIKMQKQIA